METALSDNEKERTLMMRAESTRVMRQFLRDVMKLNMEQQNFRLLVADDGRGSQALRGWAQHLAVGQQRLGRRARCRNGLLRR
jgi:phosphoketolase